MNNNFDFEEELKKIEELCRQYGYRCFVRFDEIHIITQCEAWFLIPREDGLIKLMHGNSIGQFQNGYHKQFCIKISYEELFIYITEHQKWKYSDKEVSEFTFSKTGAKECNAIDGICTSSSGEREMSRTTGREYSITSCGVY